MPGLYLVALGFYWAILVKRLQLSEAPSLICPVRGAVLGTRRLRSEWVVKGWGLMCSQHSLNSVEWMDKGFSQAASGTCPDSWSGGRSGRSQEKEMATHSSVLAWKIPWTEVPGRHHKVHKVAKSRTPLSMHAHLDFNLGTISAELWMDYFILWSLSRSNFDIDVRFKTWSKKKKLPQGP